MITECTIVTIEKQKFIYGGRTFFSSATLFCIHIISQIPYQSTLDLNEKKKKNCYTYKYYHFILYSPLDCYFNLQSLNSFMYFESVMLGFIISPFSALEPLLNVTNPVFVFFTPFEKTLLEISLTDQTHCIFCSSLFIIPWLLQRMLVDWRDMICLYSSRSGLSLARLSTWWTTFFSD